MASQPKARSFIPWVVFAAALLVGCVLLFWFWARHEIFKGDDGLPMFATNTERWHKARGDVEYLNRKIGEYAQRYTGYPPESLEILDQHRDFGPVPRDPFTGRHYGYVVHDFPTPEGHYWEITCLGSDGAPGGAAPPEQDIIATERGMK